ncbi:putative LRR receptor-like serine/threonine-protein kinase At1g06840 isoform X2 [Wolffia australiana]
MFDFERKIFIFLCLLSSFWFLAAAEETDPLEVRALRAIRSNLIDPWGNLRSWKGGDPCRSRWAGVLCFGSAENDGYLHIRSLVLLNMNLSGQIAPEVGQLSRLQVLDFMWNDITGSIPKEISKLTFLKLLLLSGNHLSGSLPEELGNLVNLNRLQIDENNISGPIPGSFSNLSSAKHFHMNNNSLSGQLPPEFYKLSRLVHLLLDNNNLTGYLPSELSQMPRLLILQLDNNNFTGAVIPPSYSNMTKLVKLSLRNCSLQGSMPDISGLPNLNFLDLSNNLLNGSILAPSLSPYITTIDLSHNMLGGSIPSSLSGLRLLQRISLENNRLTGPVPSFIWAKNSFIGNGRVILNFENNFLTNASEAVDLLSNVTLMLGGNPLCENANNSKLLKFCGSHLRYLDRKNKTSENSGVCAPQSCPSADFFEYNPASPVRCFCAAPVRVGYRLKSPGFSNFVPHKDLFVTSLTRDLSLFRYQLYIASYSWEVGPRLRMNLIFFPGNSSSFNVSEILRIKVMFTEWKIRNSDFFGPYELLNFTLLGVYSDVDLQLPPKPRKNIIVGISLGAIAGAAVLVLMVSFIVMKRFDRHYQIISGWHSPLRLSQRVDGVSSFTFKEMAAATNDFASSCQVGRGGYGKVYKGILADGTSVAIKRAQKDSLQGSKEFFTEIEFLSRLHHRNLVSMVGFCHEKEEQMIVYEFMPNGTLRDHLFGKYNRPLDFSTRLLIAVGAARGIKYLHTEASPPVFHRDIKASNILLDSKFTAKVADFGLSRLAPEPNSEENAKGHISTGIKGTPGYLDPEYLRTLQLTDKSDVYSLGVVFLELLTGMRPITHGKNIVREVSSVRQAGKISLIVDQKMGPTPLESIERFTDLGLRCCSNQTADRPRISEVVRELEIIWELTEGTSSKGSPVSMPLSPSDDQNPSSSSSGDSKPSFGSSFSPC